MAVGYPAHESALKPRLPLEAVFHENEYEDKEEQLKEYDETISAYYNSGPKKVSGRMLERADYGHADGQAA